jgi:hypothetical protein
MHHRSGGQNGTPGAAMDGTGSMALSQLSSTPQGRFVWTSTWRCGRRSCRTCRSPGWRRRSAGGHAGLLDHVAVAGGDAAGVAEVDVPVAAAAAGAGIAVAVTVVPGDYEGHTLRENLGAHRSAAWTPACESRARPRLPAPVCLLRRPSPLRMATLVMILTGRACLPYSPGAVEG